MLDEDTISRIRKFLKMFDEDPILQIQGSCDVDGEIGWWKSQPNRLNCGQKYRKRWFDFLTFWFFGRNLHHRTIHTFLPPPLHRNHRRTLEFAILIFRQTFLKIYPSQSQDLQIYDIMSSSNSFENLKFLKMFDEGAILQIRGSCDCDVSGGGECDKSRGWKNWKYSQGVEKNVSQPKAQLDFALKCRQDKSPSLVVRH